MANRETNIVLPEQNIRMACEADAPFLKACIANAYSEYVAVLGREPEAMTIDCVDLAGSGQVWVLESGMEPVALLVLKCEVGQLRIFSVAVDPRHQHQGHGRSLMRFAEKEALRLHYRRIRLCASEHMKSNIHWYQRLGYTEMRRESLLGSVLVHMEKVAHVHSAG